MMLRNCYICTTKTVFFFMIYTFFKYQCCGNDFIILHSSATISTENIVRLCDRKFGIGADGLITASKDKEGGLDIKFYNSDGSTDTLCGNGSLCSIDFAYKNLNLTNFTLNASDGKHSFIIDLNSNHSVQFHDCLPPVIHNIDIKQNINLENKKSVRGYFVNTGSPHFVIFMDNIDKIDIMSAGRYFRNNLKINPEGCNVDFVKIIGPDELSLRTFERGVEGETLGCGTGSVATAIAYTKYIDDSAERKSITLHNRGGEHRVSFINKGTSYTDVYLKGHPEMVFSGTIKL